MLMKNKFFAILCLILSALGLQAQDITVHGKVLSKTDGEPLIGASVIPASSPANGVATDIDGNFTINVKSGEKLKVTYVGFTPHTVAAAPELTILLSEDLQSLDELVVVGYTKQKKADLTGAVSVMDMNEPLSESAGNIMNSMQGRLPGVQVNIAANPGAEGSIRIRGMSTINGAEPLYVVDGVAIDNIASINPSDIESMQVLKDAASASIYGSRAANGVVIITTKHGKGGKLSVNVDYAVSAQTVGSLYQMMDSQQWGQAFWTANRNAGITNPSHPLFGNGAEPQLVEFANGDPNFPTSPGTDWQDAIYRTAWTNNLTATIYNSSERGSFLFSGNYINQDGIMNYTFYRRYSARLNSNYNFNKYVSVGENFMVANYNYRGSAYNDDKGVPFLAMSQNPAIPVYGLDGSFSNPKDLMNSDLGNPVLQLYNGRNNSNNSWRIFGNAYLEVRPIDGLTLKSNFGIDHTQYFNKYLNRRISADLENSVSREYNEWDTWTWTNTANYVKSFGKNNINALFGVEAIKYTQQNLSAARTGYAFEEESFMQIGAGSGVQTNGGGKSQWSLFSIFGKVDYNFDERYYASFTIRRDASSRLNSHNNSGVFPAFTLAWRPTKEAFFPENDILNDLKIRFAWGQNGNAAIGNWYASYSTYAYDLRASYDFDGSNTSATPGIIVASSGNTALKWETTTQTNIGLDLTMFNGSLGISADYYFKNTKDMLTEPPTLSVAGENAKMWMNTGSMENRGWEVALNYYSPRYGDFSWKGSFNIAQYKNKLTYLFERRSVLGDGDSRLIIGEPMGIYYGYVCDGIYQSAEQVANHATQPGAAPGRLIYRDLDGNGLIDENDRCIIGDPNPDLSMGLNLDFSYKDFTLSAFFSGEFGMDVINSVKKNLYFMTYGDASTNRSVDILNAWTPDNTNSQIPALTVSDDNNEARFSSYYVEDGSYVKLKYIKLTYRLPEKLLRPIHASAIHVFGQVENVFTISKYSGLDPEIPASGWGARVDNAPYPRPRVFTLGINVQF